MNLSDVQSILRDLYQQYNESKLAEIQMSKVSK